MENAKWYFTHESEEDRLWYGTFFSMCKKFNVSSQPVRGFFDESVSA